MVSDKISPNLNSYSQLEVAFALTDRYFNTIEDKNIADRLHALRDEVWDANYTVDQSKQKAVFDKALEGLNHDQVRELCECYNRMGNLYEVAGLTARDNYFNELQAKVPPEPIPGGVEAFISKIDDVDTALAKLSVPVFETTMTMHPTNVKALPPMQALRQIALALREGDDARIDEALRAYQEVPILHEVNGKKDNLTVRDETKTVINYLNNIYDDLPLIFKQYDEPLGKKYGDDYERMDLTLNARFGSWGSAGDKDGNFNVTSEKTLEGIVRHTHSIVGRYIKDLEAIDAPELDAWKEKLQAKFDKLQPLLVEAEKLSDDADALRPQAKKGEQPNYDERLPKAAELNERFDRISDAVADLRADLKPDAFEADLKAAYEKAKGANKDKLLDMTRKVRWFGFNFSKIEYRETALEYSKVVSELIPGYSKLAPEQRAERLTELLSGELPAEVLERAQAIIAKGAHKNLKNAEGDKDVTAIAYHTLKRMQLGRDHASMIKDNVLAECGKLEEENPAPEKVAAQGLANLLEAQLLQRVVEDKERGKPQALLGIVPLFEDYNTMGNIEKIMGAAYKNSAYSEHLEQLADDRHGGKLTQQVQIAHSDNRRRAGALAGTAFIHEAHRKMRNLNEEQGIALQFFEGGSLSDPFRNGVRALSAQVKAFGLQDFAKFTFQGGDLFNYFNHPGSNERMFTRNFVQSAAYVQKVGGEWQVVRNDSVDAGLRPAGSEKRDRRPNMVVEEVAIDALKKTLDDYRVEDFSREALGTLYAALGTGYDREATSTNRGSRANSRFASVSSTTVGSVIPMDPDVVRTISFSAFPQLNNLTPSPVGGQKLNKYIEYSIIARLDSMPPESARRRTDEEKAFLESFGDVITQGVQPRHMAILYDKSPAFRDAMDKSAFAVARTDMEAVTRDVTPKYERLDSASPTEGKVRSDGLSYVGKLRKTFENVGNIAYEALMGDPRNNDSSYTGVLGTERLRSGRNDQSKFLRHGGDTANDRRQAEAMEALNGLGEEIAIKNKYQDFVHYTKSRLNADGQLDNDTLDALQAAGLTATHSRWLGADDPTTAEHKLNAKKAILVRAWV